MLHIAVIQFHFDCRYKHYRECLLNEAKRRKLIQVKQKIKMINQTTESILRMKLSKEYLRKVSWTSRCPMKTVQRMKMKTLKKL